MNKTTYIEKIKFLAFLIAFLTVTVSQSFAADRYLVGNGNWNSSVWSTSATGGAGASVPGPDDVAYIQRGYTVTVTANATVGSLNFSTQTTGYLGTLTINENFTLTVNGATTLYNEAAASVSANINGSGTLNTTTLNIGNLTKPGNGNGIFTHTLVITNTSINVSGNLNIRSEISDNAKRLSNGVLSINSGTVTVSGSVITDNENSANTATLTLGNSSPKLILNGATPFSLSGGTNNIILNGTGATVVYGRAGNQTVYGINYNNLTLSGSGTKTLQAGTTSIGGNFIIDNVTATAVAALTIGGDVILEGAFNFTSSTFTHNVAGNWTRNGWGTFTPGTGTINFTGNSSAINGTSANSQTFNNIIIAKTAGQTLSVGGSVTSLNVNGDFTLSSGTFAPGTIATVISGNWMNNGGSLTTGTGAITMNGSGKTIGGTSSTTFNNLTINNNVGGILLGKDQTVNGTLTLANGLLKLGSYNLTLGASAPAISGSGYSGNMIIADGIGQVRKILTANGSYTFPIGDAGPNYSPITLNFVSGTYAAGAYVAVNVTNAKHPSNTSASNYLTRYWSVSQSGISSFSCTVTGTYQYGDDVVGQEGLQNAAEYTGALPWISYPTTLGSNTLTAAGVTTFGDFTGIETLTITTGTISGSPFCAGSVVSVPFTIKGSYTAGNVFTAQLSNASGSFTSPVNIGTLTSTAAGTIAGTIPLATATGSGYRIRVVGSTPAVTGADNGANLSINANLTATPITTGSSICIGTTSSVTLSASGAVAGDKYKWYTEATGGTLLKTSTDNNDNTYTTPVLGITTNYWVSILSSGGCEGPRAQVSATYPALSADNQLSAGTDSWIGHVYDDTNSGVAYNGNFTNYYGSYTRPETFDEGFGGDATCFGFTSNSMFRSIYTETFSVRYRMNSSKKGLYVVDLGSDDGSRLTVDGTKVYDDWGAHAFAAHNAVLINLKGNSSLLYDFFENGGGNRVVFQNLTPVLANNLTTNTTQTINSGSTGVAISGDVFGTLPTGITLSGTGYQWVYSTTPGGATTNIAGATGATFTPNTTTAPFNVAGVYYVYRNAVLSSANNYGNTNPTLMTNQSNAATITIAGIPTITVSPTTLTGFSYPVGSGPSSQLKSFTVSGTNMAENIRLSLPPDSKFELSTESGGLFLGSVNALLINNGSGNVPTTTIYVRLKAGISVGSYSDIITASSTGATSRTITVSGTVTNQPIITVTPGALTGMSYVLGYGPSATQTFNVKGTSIVDNVTVTAPADFEISRTSDTTGFTSTSFTVTKAEAEAPTGKTVWVRLKSGLSTSTYNQDITLTATYADDVIVNCQGTVNRATINVSEFTLAGFIYTSGAGPSEVQSFNASGYALSSNITITAPADFEISTSQGGLYTSSIPLSISSGVLEQSTGVLNSTPIYVRMKSGRSVGVIPAENILLTANNAITQSVACSGEVVSGAASISSNPNLNGFFYIVGQGPSIVQSFTVSATGLSANVTVAAPTDFEISGSGAEGSFVNNFSIAPNGGKINASRVYIRLKAGKTVGTYNGNVTLTSTGTTTVNVACVGKVVPVPTITAGPANPYNVCAGSNVTLTSTGSNIINQSWSGPNGFYSTSPSPNLGTGTTALNGNYTVTGAVGSGVNLLTNGDFELGNTGFGSTYAYNTGTYGRYVITNNPSSVDATYFINGTDHTPSPGTQMMVVDGAATTGAIIWSQTIAVNPNTAYQFSYYAENINITSNTNYAKLQLYVNNVPVGPINTISVTSWNQYLCNINSGTSTSLQLTLINTFIGGSGNDFGLDDMVFEQVFQVSSTVPLTVNPLVTPSVVIAASSNPSTEGATVTFTATPTNGGTNPTYAWYINNSGTLAGTGSTFSYVPHKYDHVKCVLTSSLQCTTANPVESTFIIDVTPSTNYWIGTNSTDWGTASNWTANFVPIPGADVVFATVDNNGSAAVNDLVLDQNRTQGSLINQTTKRLVIPVAKVLTINNNIITDGNTSRIHIQASSTSPNGSLIYYGNSAVYATVEMYSKSSWDVNKTNPKQRYNWQYFGIPVDTIKANPTFYGAYVRERNEAGNDTLTHWQSLTNESNVIPFKGYELCYETPRLISFKGKLVNRNFNSGPLSKTTSGGVLYPGQYIFANPYTAAIDILQLGLGSGMEQKIYLYNTGTFEQWNAVKVSGQIGNAPGQYTVVPKGLAGTNLIPRQLPSMGSMLVRVADPTPNAYVSINYNSVAMGNTDMQRMPSEQMRYQGMSTRFDIVGKTSTDRMWLVPDEKFTRSYDDGYDGEKIPGSALDPQIYAIEEDGNYQVGAIDDLNNTTMAFQAGQDTEYKMTVVHENAEGKYSKIYLVDIVANVVADITESGTEYLFTAVTTAKPVNRFKIIANSAADGVVNLTSIKVFSMNNNICVYNDTKLEAKVSVYDLAGRNCGYKTVSANGITTFPVRLQQAYIVKAVTDVLSETTKIIIK